jgi:hypothetical protein
MVPNVAKCSLNGVKCSLNGCNGVTSTGGAIHEETDAAAALVVFSHCSFLGFSCNNGDLAVITVI